MPRTNPPPATDFDTPSLFTYATGVAPRAAGPDKKDGDKDPNHTTQMVGEEETDAPPPDKTTPAVGEEGPGGVPTTTIAKGEESQGG